MVRMRFKVKTEPGLKTEENSNVFNELGAILNVFSQLGYVSERYMYFITSKRKSQAKVSGYSLSITLSMAFQPLSQPLSQPPHHRAIEEGAAPYWIP